MCIRDRNYTLEFFLPPLANLKNLPQPSFLESCGEVNALAEDVQNNNVIRFKVRCDIIFDVKNMVKSKFSRIGRIEFSGRRKKSNSRELISADRVNN